MENTENLSGDNKLRPEVDESIVDSFKKVMDEIKVIIENTHWVETRIANFKANGFKIESCWVKNGRIGTIWYMKRKKLFRIQVTDSVLHGNYHKAFCVIIPENEVDLLDYDLSSIRNIQKK